MQNKKPQKRELILDAAFELILEKGYSNTKIIDIATKAGIGKGTVYEYFENKESIALELVRTRAAADYAKICELADELPTCREKLTKYFQLQVATVSRYKANVTDFRNEFMGNNSEISMEIIEAVQDIVLSQLEFVGKVVRRGIDCGEFKNLNPDAATVCISGSINFWLGMLYHSAEYPQVKVFRRVLASGDEDSVFECIFKGLLA